ncbi:MAG: hypothetical protein JJT88_11785 [Gammaproteobacteria bacterium]|nr:hypothetical protein [Gammaproteobacteria bacterium]
MRIAILILLHQLKDQQLNLISHLAQDFQVYVHLDRKSRFDVACLDGFGNVRAFKKHKVYWGGYSQIVVTLDLLSLAFEDVHDRYIIISGDDLPIKSNDAIVELFDGNTFEYLQHEELPRDSWRSANGGFDRVDYFYPSVRKYGGLPRVQRLVNIALSRFFRVLRPLYPKRRLKVRYYGGANWMNLTHDCVSELVRFTAENPDFVRSFRYTRCADEIFFQTIICNLLDGCRLMDDPLRYVDWESGPERPRVLRMSDYEKLINSDAIFARKFSAEVDNEIIVRILSRLRSEGTESGVAVP